MTKTKIVALLSVLALLASLPLTVVLAQGAPYLVIGTAILDDEPAMMGTMVVAMVGEEKVGEGEVLDAMGHYRLLITGGSQGDTVMIYLIMGEGDEAMEYLAMTDEDVMIGTSGDSKMVDLMAFSGEPPATPSTDPALAQGAPYLVIGTAMLDDEPAMMGTMVVAMVGEEKVGEGEVLDAMGHYRLLITGGNPGDTVMIYLIMGEGDEAMEYLAMTDEDVMIGASGDSKMVDLMAFSGAEGHQHATAMLSSQEPGAAVQITLSATAMTGIQPNQDITIELKGFGMPETIADSAISITSADFKGSPTGVLVTGSKITMTVPQVRSNGDPQEKAVSGAYTIKIKQSAGISNPASGGAKTITLQENAPDGAVKEFTATINRVIKLSKTAGTRGTVATATFKGFSNGTARVSLNGEKYGEVTIADNTGTLELDTASSKFMANREGGNVITATDGSGNMQDVSGKFTISPKVVLDPEEISVSKMVTVKLSDWPANNAITEVKIGATTSNPTTSQSTDADGKAEFMVLVPSDVNHGTQTVKVTGTMVGDSTPSASASLKVGVLALSAQPTMVVPGQQITIQGSGFVAGDSFNRVVVGGITVLISPAVSASSAGDIVITINVPSPWSGPGIGSGKKTISVTAIGSNRVAEGEIEIPKAAITLDPEISRRGTTVSVSGTGFPSGDLVQVKYDNNGTFVTVAAGSADAYGAVSTDFVVPSFARIGTKHDMEATSVGVYAGVTAKATHETPGAMVTLSTQRIASGQNITISGMNFPAFATVAVMEIGGVDVRPVPAPVTSIDGAFESTVLVPQLELGNQTVSVRVSSTTITTFLEIATVTDVSDEQPATVQGYDKDKDGVISISELFDAIDDYFDGDISISQLFDVIDAYFG